MKLFSRSRAGRSGRTSGPINPFVRPENRPTDLRLVDRFQFLPRAVRAFLTRHSVIMWCIVGCDPDVGGALAVITGHNVGFIDTVRIFDCPTQTVMVNRRPRERMCVDGMVALVRGLDLPARTVAHLEVGGGRSAYNAQTCFVQGSATGTWHGVLVSHDFDVRLVAASTWKWALNSRVGGHHATKATVATWQRSCSRRQTMMSLPFSGARRTTVGRKPCSSPRTVTGQMGIVMC